MNKKVKRCLNNEVVVKCTINNSFFNNGVLILYVILLFII